jgi:hypothetical protein
MPTRTVTGLSLFLSGDVSGADELLVVSLDE